VICLALVAVPFALAALLLFVYGAFVLFGVRAGVHWLIH
jgi:predicted HAD superfamily Cof-like phosphohydrolase